MKNKQTFNKLDILYLFMGRSILLDVWDFMRENKKWWLLPIIIILLVFGILIILTQSSAVSPFIYALF